MEKETNTLIQDLQHQKPAACQKLLTEYGPAVFRMVQRIITQREDAEEVYQDVFVKALRGIQNYNPKQASLGTWLSRIAYNESLNFLRSRKPNIIYIDDRELGSDSFEVPDDAPQDEHTIALLEQALSLLPPHEQAIISMFYYEEKSLADIAYITGSIPSTVGSQLSRIRKKLYRIIKKTPLHRGRGWRWVFLAAACVAGFVVIFLAPPKSAEKQPPLALEKPRVESQEPIADSQFSTPLKGRLGSLELPLNVATAPQRGANPHSRRRARMEGASQQPAVVKPKRTPKRKRVVPQEPQEEPLLAEAESVEEFPTEAAYQEFLDKMRKPSTSSYATQAQEIRQRGEQVTQYVAMLNQQIRAEQQYVEY